MRELSASDIALNPNRGVTGAAELQQLAGAVLGWLQGSTVSEELAAAGYKPYHLQQRLSNVVAAVGEMLLRQSVVKSGVEAGVFNPEMLADFELCLVDELRGLGHALSIFAVPNFCNNPCCSYVSGATELGRMLGRSCKCAGCMVAHYCSRACQVQHRREHKWVCKKLAAAAARACQQWQKNPSAVR